MSGGAFEYNQYRINDIIDDIKSEIDNNGKEIPEEDRLDTKGWYDKYPEDKYYAEYSDDVIKEMKKSIYFLERAYVYSQRIDWYLSGDDGEDSFFERLESDLKNLKSKLDE